MPFDCFLSHSDVVFVFSLEENRSWLLRFELIRDGPKRHDSFSLHCSFVFVIFLHSFSYISLVWVALNVCMCVWMATPNDDDKQIAMMTTTSTSFAWNKKIHLRCFIVLSNILQTRVAKKKDENEKKWKHHNAMVNAVTLLSPFRFLCLTFARLIPFHSFSIGIFSLRLLLLFILTFFSASSSYFSRLLCLFFYQLSFHFAHSLISWNKFKTFFICYVSFSLPFHCRSFLFHLFIFLFVTISALLNDNFL